MTPHKVRVTRPGRTFGPWFVSCTGCSAESILAFFDAFARATTYRDALVLARWLRQLHVERACGTCGQVPTIEPIRVEGHDGLFTHEGTMYRLTSAGVFRFEEVSA